MLLPGALCSRGPLLFCPGSRAAAVARCLRSSPLLLRCEGPARAAHGHAQPPPRWPQQPEQRRFFLSRRVPPPFGAPQTRGAKTGRQKKKQETRSQEEDWRARNKTALTYIAAAGVGMIGLSYAAVPLYRLYCQASGLGGTAVAGHDADQVENMTPVKERVIKISFNADTHASMQWNFRPQQTEIYVVPGETALAFYRAKNPTDKPVIGISTYNVVPYDAGQYFNKIQCFCFEEQRLNPQEEVDMPVFFYIDPEFDTDPRMARVDTITLSYTFFEAKEGQKLPLPGYS